LTKARTKDWAWLASNRGQFPELVHGMFERNRDAGFLQGRLAKQSKTTQDLNMCVRVCVHVRVLVCMCVFM
jgi:hypothetical protein